MSDEMVVRCCAPTLGCLKTGSLFNAPFDTKEDMRREVRRLNRMLRDMGMRVIPLKWLGGRALVYLYRPAQLEADLRDEVARRILMECGYTGTSVCGCIGRLMQRLECGGEFPHEIGLFLGYPPRDVDGFMHRRQECVLCGRWKVYDDPERARAIWQACDGCTAHLLARLRAGDPLSALAVPS